MIPKKKLTTSIIFPNVQANDVQTKISVFIFPPPYHFPLKLVDVDVYELVIHEKHFHLKSTHQATKTGLIFIQMALKVSLLFLLVFKVILAYKLDNYILKAITDFIDVSFVANM